MNFLTIAIPTYNESANLPLLIEGIRSATRGLAGVECRVLVVDDNSPDGTGKLAEELAKDLAGEGFRIDVMHRRTKEGLGKAYADAFSVILAEGGADYVLQMDADLSHDPSYIPALVAAVPECDFVVGSRYVPGGGTPDWSWYRKLLSRGGNRYARFFLGSGITDYTGGYNLFSVDLLRRCEVTTLQARGYGFLIELKHRALNNCRRSRQVPIVFHDRRAGESKIPRSTLFQNLVMVPSIRVADRRRRARH